MGESSGHWLARAQDGVTIFLGVVIEAAPFLVVGVLVSQVLAVAVRRDWLVAWLPRGRLTSLTALAGLGAAFPVCECGNVPVARRLIGRGIPVAAALVFLLSAPALNPVVALSTFAAFRDRPSIVVLRLSLTLAVAVGIGLLFSFHPRPAAMLRRGGAPRMLEAAEDRPVPAGRARRFAGGVLEELTNPAAHAILYPVIRSIAPPRPVTPGGPGYQPGPPPSAHLPTCLPHLHAPRQSARVTSGGSLLVSTPWRFLASV